VDEVLARGDPARRSARNEHPCRARWRDTREPEDPDRHEQRPDAHEDLRTQARRESTESGGEEDKEEPTRDAREACRRRGISQYALKEEREVIEGHIQRSVDQEGRDVRHREVPRLE